MLCSYASNLSLSGEATYWFYWDWDHLFTFHPWVMGGAGAGDWAQWKQKRNMQNPLCSWKLNVKSLAWDLISTLPQNTGGILWMQSYVLGRASTRLAPLWWHPRVRITGMKIKTVSVMSYKMYLCLCRGVSASKRNFYLINAQSLVIYLEMFTSDKISVMSLPCWW